MLIGLGYVKGSGSIFETLHLGKPLIVVVNEDLMDNHQKRVSRGTCSEESFAVCSASRTLSNYEGHESGVSSPLYTSQYNPVA